MGTNNIAKFSPCLVMSLFGIASTRTGKEMTAKQIHTGFKDLEKINALGMEAKNKYYVKDMEKVINYALNILGSSETAKHVKREELSEVKNFTIPENTQPTIVRTTVKTKSGGSHTHFGEGDSRVKLFWDPLGKKTIINIDRIDYFKFEKKQERMYEKVFFRIFVFFILAFFYAVKKVHTKNIQKLMIYQLPILER